MASIANLSCWWAKASAVSPEGGDWPKPGPQCVRSVLAMRSGGVEASWITAASAEPTARQVKIAEAENDGQDLNVRSQRMQKRELDLETVLAEMGDMVRLRLRAARQKRPSQVCRDRQRAAREQPFALTIDRERRAKACVVGTDQNRGGGERDPAVHRSRDGAGVHQPGVRTDDGGRGYAGHVGFEQGTHLLAQTLRRPFVEAPGAGGRALCW